MASTDSLIRRSLFESRFADRFAIRSMPMDRGRPRFQFSVAALLAAVLLSGLALPGCVERVVSSKSYGDFAVDTDSKRAPRSERSTRGSQPALELTKPKADPLGDIWRGLTGLFDGEDKDDDDQQTRRPAQPQKDAAPEVSKEPTRSPFADE